MASNTGLSIAQAMILAALPSQGFSQANADVKVQGIIYSQALASMVKFAKQTGFGQANADIKTTYSGSAQAQAFVTI